MTRGRYNIGCLIILVLAVGCARPTATGSPVRQAFPSTALTQGFICDPPDYVQFVRICGQGAYDLIVRIQCDQQALLYGVVMAQREKDTLCL